MEPERKGDHHENQDKASRGSGRGGDRPFVLRIDGIRNTGQHGQ